MIASGVGKKTQPLAATDPAKFSLGSRTAVLTRLSGPHSSSQARLSHSSTLNVEHEGFLEVIRQALDAAPPTLRPLHSRARSCRDLPNPHSTEPHPPPESHRNPPLLYHAPKSRDPPQCRSAPHTALPPAARYRPPSRTAVPLHRRSAPRAPLCRRTAPSSPLLQPSVAATPTLSRSALYDPPPPSAPSYTILAPTPSPPPLHPTLLSSSPTNKSRDLPTAHVLILMVNHYRSMNG